MKALATILIGGMAVFGQFGDGSRGDTIRARFHGGGGDGGKCTAEVEVDGAADVIVSGDTGRIRNLYGAYVRWRRLDCTGPMPASMQQFRFRGVDGRGRQNLVQDPRGGRGTAVVRIEDRNGGSEAYTFDLEWWNGRGPNWGNAYSGREEYGDWDRGWGDRVVYRGRGRGEIDWRRGRDWEIYGVDVMVDRRSGQVTVRMDTNAGRDSLVFTGRLQRVTGKTIYADVRGGGNGAFRDSAVGQMRIRLDNGRRVDDIRMDGEMGGRSFRLRWSD